MRMPIGLTINRQAKMENPKKPSDDDIVLLTGEPTEYVDKASPEQLDTAMLDVLAKLEAGHTVTPPNPPVKKE